MMGKRHIVCGLASGGALFAGVTASLDAAQGHELTHEVLASVHDALAPSWASEMTHAPLFIIGVVLVLALGSIWPDCDTSSSMVGRYVPTFAMRHRGWTHTDWALMLLVGMCLFDPTHLGWWFTIGYASHLFFDELSVAGRVHFYPITNFKVISRGGHEIVVKKNWHGLYTTGAHSASERAVVFGVIVIATMIIAASAGVSMM